MNIREKLINSFKMYAVLSENLLDKCEQICNTYDMSAEDLADQWGAYCATTHIDLVPTSSALDVMERKELKKQNKELFSINKGINTPSSRIVYSENYDPQSVILNSYSTPSKNFEDGMTTAKNIKTPTANLNNSSLIFDPSTFNTPVSGSKDTVDNNKLNSVLLSYGLQKFLNKATFKRNPNGVQHLVNIELLPELKSLSEHTRYMYEVMNAKAASLNWMTEWLGKCLIKEYKLDDPQPFTKTTGSLTTYGRICCDADGRLNAASVLLEGTYELTKGFSIPLNLNQLSNYAIFPGQVVATQGFNPTGNNLIVQKLYNSSHPNSPLDPVTFKEQLQIVVAAGPFTLGNNLAYDPLKNLMDYVRESKPHILILIGPFVDASHQNITSTLVESFDVFFETLLSCIMTPLEELNIQVVIVPSQKDAHHHNIFPTMPYTIRNKYPNLQCVTDPSLLNIQGLILGITSTDILFHLGKEEIWSTSLGGDRMSRLVGHLLGQKNFYPLYPPDNEMCIDHKLLEQYGLMEVTPHILIIPSNLHYFIKQVHGCVAINPERLAKEHVAGTYVRIEVSPLENNEPLVNNVTAQIMKI